MGNWCTVRPHLSAPQTSSSLTFCSSFYRNKSAIILLYTILLLPRLSSSLTLYVISPRTDVCGYVRSDCNSLVVDRRANHASNPQQGSTHKLVFIKEVHGNQRRAGQYSIRCSKEEDVLKDKCLVPYWADSLFHDP